MEQSRDRYNSPLRVFHELVAQTRLSRLNTLLATFDSGYAKQWAFPIPQAFQEAIDVRYTPRTANKVTTYFWTQGSRFDFHEGYVVYDTPKAYLPWEEALRHINMAFRVTKSSPAIPATNEPRKWDKRPDDAEIKSYIKSFGQNYVSHTEETKRNGNYILRVQTKRFAGYLEVAMLRPNEGRTTLDVTEAFPISQDDFVEWLITGTDPMERRQKQYS